MELSLSMSPPPPPPSGSSWNTSSNTNGMELTTHHHVLGTTTTTTTTRTEPSSSSSSPSPPLRLYGRDREKRLLWDAYERSKHHGVEPQRQQQQPPETASIGSTAGSERNPYCHDRWNHSHSTASSSSSASSSLSSTPPTASSSSLPSLPSVKIQQGQELVLIRGASGTGKTSLAQSLRSKVENEDDGFFLEGKFDWTTRQDPYAVFVAAMTQFTETLVMREQQQQHQQQHTTSQSTRNDCETEEEKVEEDAVVGCNGYYDAAASEDDNSNNDDDDNRQDRGSLFQRLRRVLQQAVGAEGRVLTDHIPALKQILEPRDDGGDAKTNTNNHHNDDIDNDQDDDDDEEVQGDDMGVVVVSRSSLSGTEALRRFQFVFAKFIRAISTMVPLVLFLDDLQWSDQASLDLLQAVLTPPVLKSTDDSSTTTTTTTTTSAAALLVIGAYRHPESTSLLAVTSASCHNKNNTTPSPFQEHLQTHWLVPCSSSPSSPLSTSSSSSAATTPTTSATSATTLRITNIALSNLTEAAVHEMVAATLQLSPDSTAALAQVVHAKSSGNAFHALQYLRLLSHEQKQQQQHRRDSNSHREHSCKLQQVQATLAAPPLQQLQQPQPTPPLPPDHQGLLVEEEDDEETVDDLVCRILLTLPPFTLEVLKIASCMKDEIDPTVMELVLEEGKSTCDIARALDLAVNEGILSSFTPEQGRYRFIHDRIRHAAFSFVENPDALSLHIGRRLCQGLCSITLTASVFTVVNLLNKGIDLITDQQERYKVAELNLEAGVRAASLAAFPDAAQYLQVGIALCQGSKSWEEQYHLTLSLYNGTADAELCNQRFERVREITQQVFQNAQCLRDKLPSYITQINAAGQSGKVHEAIAMGFDVLEQLGEPFPSKPTTFLILKDLIKTKVMIRGRSNENLLSLKPMVDETKLAAIHIMNILIPYAVQSASPQLVLLGTRLVQVCLTFGLSKACSVGFNTYGWVLCRHDRKQGYRFGKLALSIIEKLRAREMIPRVHSIFYFWNCHWMRPLRETLEPLRHAYTVGMEIGDIEYGLHAAMFRCFHSLFSGLPLPQVSEMFVDTMNKLRHFKLEILLQCTNVRFQLVSALMGSNVQGRASPSSGELLQRFAVDEPDNKLIALLHYSCGATLAYLLGDLGIAEKLVEKRLALKFDLFAEFFYALDQFQHGLIAIARARSGIDKLGNVKTARKVVKMMAIWAKDCPFNFLNKKRLLEAELRSLQAKKTACRKIHRLYGQAFQLASEQGLTHEAALACELAGDFMDRHGERYLASTYWDKSHALYLEWGATAKAAQLQSRTPKIARTQNMR